ncbi:MAG TPA: ACT domain-containing protein [Tepidisphaeraceae bacterium]|jgi:hypothetical protein
MLSVSKADVWAATCEDRPGGLNEKLEGLAKAGANLEFVLARRLHEEPAKGVLFVTPLRGAEEQAAAKLGFRKTLSLYSLRIEGPDEAGLGAKITRALAAENINLRGLSAARSGNQFIAYLAVDSEDDAQRAANRLQKPL